MNEACLNTVWIGKDLTNREAIDFTKKTLNFMRDRLSDYQEKYGDLYNLEATPAESTSYRLAKHDRDRWPDIITASQDDNVPYYTNSSHLPVGYTEDVFTALDVQDELQTLYTSGTVFHTFLGQRLENWQATMNLVRKIAENYKLPYYTMSPTYSVCATHGYLAGEQENCPHCGAKTEIYSRITGYYRPVANWNDGKSQEYKERKTYDMNKSVLKKKNTEEVVCGENGCVLPKQNKEVNNTKAMLFTTPTCPNCKVAKVLLGNANIDYELIDATENKELNAPTLVIPNGDMQLVFGNVSEIKKYIEGLKK